MHQRWPKGKKNSFWIHMGSMLFTCYLVYTFCVILNLVFVICLKYTIKINLFQNLKIVYCSNNFESQLLKVISTMVRLIITRDCTEIVLGALFYIEKRVLLLLIKLGWGRATFLGRNIQCWASKRESREFLFPFFLK